MPGAVGGKAGIPAVVCPFPPTESGAKTARSQRDGAMVGLRAPGMIGQDRSGYWPIIPKARPLHRCSHQRHRIYECMYLGKPD